MSTNQTATGSAFGKILAGAFLHDFRDDGKTGPQLIQTAIGKLRKYLGQEQTKAFFEATEDSHRALACATLDQIVLDQLTTETKEAMSKLPVDQRIIIEGLFLKFTGQDFMSNNDARGRWPQPLWNIRRHCIKYLELSPTEVKPEELLQALKDVALPMLNTLREHVNKTL